MAQQMQIWMRRSAPGHGDIPRSQFGLEKMKR
jgi:hypothetical protein